jgi:hypothetical protein
MAAAPAATLTASLAVAMTATPAVAMTVTPAVIVTPAVTVTIAATESALFEFFREEFAHFQLVLNPFLVELRLYTGELLLHF